VRRVLSALASIVALAGAAGAADAQDTGGDPARILATWQSSDATCRNPKTAALAAVAACEQRDTYAKRLMQLNFCAAPSGSAEAWRRCPAGTEAANALPKTTVQLARAGGIFVVPVLLNGTVRPYAILDSGAANLQISQEIADELRRNGTLTDADGLGRHRYIMADGKGIQQHVFRLKSLQIGDKVMASVLASIGPPNSKVLLGQSVLRRVNGWAIDNVRNTLTLD
jgi:predicted aspartyl protease